MMPRVRRPAVLVVVLGLLAATLSAVPAVAAAAPSAPVPSSSSAHRARYATHRATGHTTRYARIQPLCPPPAKGTARCMALRRVSVHKGAKGAVAYSTLTGAHGPHDGYSPADLAGVYQIDPDAGTHAVVAVVDAYDDPRIEAELNHFDRHYGLPAETSASFRKVNQAGGSAAPKTKWDWATETALDVEAVRGMCNHCKVVLVEARTASNRNLATAENTAARLGADVISNSYGAPELNVTHAMVRAYRHPGLVITAATGDDGWYDWDLINAADDVGLVGLSDNMPNAPASLPSVVAVGGTTLRLNRNGTRASETVWNGNGRDNRGAYLGASGGGCSMRFTAPSWQLRVAGYAHTGCGRKRLAGDVSLIADPRTGYSVYVPATHHPETKDGWQVIGGTSLSAPLLAGMYGLIGGSGGVRYPAESLYRNFRDHPDWAYDVTKGGDAFCGGDAASTCATAVRAQTLGDTGNPNNLSDPYGYWLGLLDCAFAYDGSSSTRGANTQCNAAPGYDGPSGVGTPNGLNLLRPPPSG
jgi:hypothetical protein